MSTVNGAPTLLKECDGYELSSDCVPGTIVYYITGVPQMRVLPRSEGAVVDVELPVQYAPVPEPATLVMGVVGMVIMMWHVHRMRRQL